MRTRAATRRSCLAARRGADSGGADRGRGRCSGSGTATTRLLEIARVQRSRRSPAAATAKPVKAVLECSDLLCVCGVRPPISAALCCDTVKTGVSASGGAGRSPARKFYRQPLWSRQNLHARRPTAPRWIAALIETCAGGVKRVSAVHSTRAAGAHVPAQCYRPPRWTTRAAAAPQGRTQSTAAARQTWYACIRKMRTAPPC